MDLIFELIIRRFIIEFLGVNFRYFCFALVGNKKNFSELRGYNSKGDMIRYSQHIYNIITGLILFVIISFSVVYMVF